MSFSVDLWNSIDNVENNFMLHYRGLKDFIYMISILQKSEYSHAKTLKELHDMNYAVTTFESLYEGIKGFKGDMLNQYNYTKEFCDELREECIIPLTNLTDSLLKRIEFSNQNMKNTEKDYIYTLNKLQSSKEKYHEASKVAEIFKIKFELNKGKVININKNVIDKDEFKAQESEKSAKQYENIYINAVNDANFMQENYIETKKNYLNYIQDLEEELAENIKIALRKFIIFQAAFARNMQYDMEKKAKLMEDINVKNDIKKYIFRKSTKDMPPKKIEFIPYVNQYSNIDQKELEKNVEIQKIISSKVFAERPANNAPSNQPGKDSFKTSNITSKINVTENANNVVTNVRSFFSGVFFNNESSLTTGKVNSAINEINENHKKEIEIDNILTSAFEGKSIDDEMVKSLDSYISNKRNRKFVLELIEKRRLKGITSLNDYSYKFIGDILLKLIDKIEKEKSIDFVNVQKIINLSIVLYKTEQNNKNYLQNYIKNHSIWKNLKFWTGYIKYCIVEEMHNQKNNNVYSSETFAEKNDRIAKIVYGQINYYIYTAISIGVNVDIIKKSLDYFNEYYDIKNEYIEQNMKLIKDYEEKVKNETKDLNDKDKDKSSIDTEA